MKILYLSAGPVVNNLLDKVAEKLRILGHEVEILKLSENEIMLIQTKHFQMYEKILDYTEKNEFNVLFYHDYLAVPEYLIFNLKTRPNYKPKIIFQSMFRESNRSMSRALSMKELLDLPQILGTMVGCGGINLEDVKLPDNLEKIEIDRKKIVFMKEPIPSKLYNKVFDRKLSREELGIEENEFVALWNGRAILSKGIDTFIESAKWINPKIKLLLKLNPRHSDISNEEIEKIKQYHSNTIIKFYPDNYYFAYCGDADIMIGSHKKLYEYGQSGIPIAAALEGLPLIAPDFYFFNEVVKKYKLGLLFKPESPRDLASAINSLYYNYDTIKKGMKEKEFIKNYAEYEDALIEGFSKLIYT